MNIRNWKYTSVSYNIFVGCITLFYGLAFTLTGFIHTPFASLHDFLVLVCQWGCICIAIYGLWSVLSINRWLFALCFPAITLLCTSFAYFSYTINVNVTPMLIHLIANNMGDAETCMTLVEPQLIVLCLLSLVLSVGVVIYRWRKIQVQNYCLNLLIGIFLVLITTHWVKAFKNPVTERLPYSIYFSTQRFLEERGIVSQERNTFTIAPKVQSDSLTVVFVIGESLRADHLSINGYSRETTPFAAKEKNLVSLPNVYSQHIYTHVSVPHILTRADSTDTSIAYKEPSFITIFNQAGFRSSWLANQESTNNYVYFMNECDSLIYVNSGKSLFIIDKWMDKDILPHYRNTLMNPAPKQLIIAHTIGSHWYYPTHFEEAEVPFYPNAKSKILSSNTREEMVNSYDNTIVETDRVLHQMIAPLRKKNAILLFLSDHGESLGEDGFYLHATDRPELHHPACFVWYSDIYAKNHPLKIKALRQNKDKRYPTDFLFHSILDAGTIESVYQKRDLNLFEVKDTIRE